MTRQKVEKSRKVVITLFMLLLFVGGIETITTSTEFGLADLIIDKCLIPILLMSTLMSAYWILLTDDFWDLRDGIEGQLGALVKTIAKFLIWIPGMAMCFYLYFHGFLSIYNRTAEAKKTITVSGPVVDKDNFRSRYYFEIRDEKLGRNIEIKISQADFEGYSIGDVYSIDRKIGALGLIYN